jgi:hypothetical protein
MSGSILLHRQRSPEDLQQLRAWYKIRDTLFGHNWLEQDIKKAFNLASFCEHPNAVWLTTLFDGREVSTWEQAIQAFRGCENDARAVCFGGLLREAFAEIRRAADLGDAFAQAEMAGRTNGQEQGFHWAEKSAAQGERDGFCYLGYCYRNGIGCQKDVHRANENFLIAAELGHVRTMICVGDLLDNDDPQRFVWFGRAAANGESSFFLDEMRDQICNFNSGIGNAKIVFVIGRALKGHINNEKGTIFGEGYIFHNRINPANQALHFYEFQLQSYQKTVDSWTIVGLRNNVVKDIRKMIGKMIWGAREQAAYLEKK